MTSRTLTLTTACLLAVGPLAGSVAAQQPLVMERATVRDPMAINKDAVTFLKPKGWKVEGSVRWYPNLWNQACVEVKVSNPDNLEQLETFPWACCSWFTNPVIPMKRGTNYMGTFLEPPCEDPREYVRQYAIPLLRKGTDATIVSYQEMPEVAKSLVALNDGARVRSGRTRIEYRVNGQLVQEDIYVSLYMVRMNLGVNGGESILWGPAWPPYAIRAPKGQLDAVTPLLLATVNSGQVNPYWFGEYNYVCDLFRKRHSDAIRQAKETSDHITRNNEEIRQMFRDSYEKRQASMDRINQNFSDYIRGVTRYHSPHSTYPVQLPSGYSYAWAGSNGTYIMSNNAGFDPNVGSTQTFQQMKQAR